MGTGGEVEERVDSEIESSPGLTESKWFCAEEVPGWGSGGGAASSLTLEEGAIGKLEKKWCSTERKVAMVAMVVRRSQSRGRWLGCSLGGSAGGLMMMMMMMMMTEKGGYG
ncbi:hypothetical protein PIB30_063530 [Stylosanthes scabra]|uniref:Uncharacterized protein n=1 Tax=Stylosanthes scabra TaxID=79078 RepID=A0ABU6ZK97_9FABA|nr:hypothetical protein [Stylosanthes scabra]